MNPDGLEAIAPVLNASGIRLEPLQRQRILAYVGLLLQWNRRINLTGARDRANLLRRHILDCLMLETVPRADALRSWLDAGSGAGLPGLLIAIMHPDYRVTAMETVAKKVTFQQFAAQTLGLSNYTVLRRDVYRPEEAGEALGTFDVLVARAFAKLAPLLLLATRLLRPGGELWAMKGARWAEELQRVPPEYLRPYEDGYRRITYRLAPAAEEGVVLIYRKRDAVSTEA